MARPRKALPSYRLHRQSGQALVTLTDGFGRRRDVLLGRHGTAESKAEYHRVVAEWEAGGRRIPEPSAERPDLTVTELIAAYMRHAEEYYRHPDGRPTTEVANLAAAFRPLNVLCGHILASDFGPLALESVRGAMVKAKHARTAINKNVSRIKRLFRWAVAKELLPPSTRHALEAVEGLKRGRTPAVEREPVKPVPVGFVEAVLPHVLSPVRAMIGLQRLTGMRPGEVCRMRACDVDMTGKVWIYKVPQHKTAWRGRERIVVLGPKAQVIVREFLTMNTTDYLFSPERAKAEHEAGRRRNRKTPLYPSHLARLDRQRRKAPKRPPRDHYDAMSYQRAVRRGCRKAGVPAWSPNRLRHNFATEVRRQHGLEAAQVALGHSYADVTQVYAERDLSLAERVALEVG